MPGPRRKKPSGSRLLTRSSRVSMWCGLGLGVAVYILFGIVPALGNILVSFTNYSGFPGSPTSFTGFFNYTVLFVTQRPGFTASLVATVVFVVSVTVVQNAVGLLLAHRLQGDSKSATVLRILAFLPIVLGVTVVGIVWLLLFDPLSSPAEAVFGAVGIHSAFFGSNNLAMPLVIVVQAWQNLGFTMVVFIGALKTIPHEIYEAATMDLAWLFLSSVHRRIEDDPTRDLRGGDHGRSQAVEAFHSCYLASNGASGISERPVCCDRIAYDLQPDLCAYRRNQRHQHAGHVGVQ